jgi:hypothetical protein
MAAVDASDTGNSIDSSFKSVCSTNSNNSNITSVTTSSELLVPGKLFSDITSLTEVYLDITRELYTSLNTKKGSKPIATNVELITATQLNTALKTLLKPSLVEKLTKLYNCVRPICLPAYSQDNRPKKNEAQCQQDSDVKLVLDKIRSETASTEKRFEEIQRSLHDLTSSISHFQSSGATTSATYRTPGPGLEAHHEPPPPPIIKHGLSHISSVKENFIDTELHDAIVGVLDHENFIEESGRGVAQYGSSYKYMGSKADSVKELPPCLDKIMKMINASETGGQYSLNSVLVNKYEGTESYLPEHSDDEFSINPISDIFTLSLGSSRPIIFRDTFSDKEYMHEAVPCSLYAMSRDSQDVFRHRIDKEDGFPEVRYSITFRCVHWSFLNSTCVIGDSNTGSFKFGTEKGTFGASTPGKQVFAATVDDIVTSNCHSYRNAVLVVGTNDLKKYRVDSKNDINMVYENYKSKISEITRLNSRCKIHIMPVLPTKFANVNRKIIYFNDLLFDDLVKCFPRISLVRGSGQFADSSSGMLSEKLSRRKGDPLHINDAGVCILIRRIKESLFQKKKTSRNAQGNRTSTVSQAGPPGPASPTDLSPS